MLRYSRHPIAAAVLAAILLANPLQAQEGREDLDQATELQITARSLRDLEKVTALCESALKKGLDEEDQKFAKQLLASAMMQHGEQLANAAMGNPRPRQWAVLRHVAIRSLEKVATYEPGNGDAHLLIAKLQLLPNGDLKRAGEAADAAVKVLAADKNKLAEALILRAQLADKPEDRLPDLNRAVEVAPQKNEAWQALAAHYFSTGKLEESVKAFRKLIKLDPDNVTARLAMAETLSNMDKRDEAQAEIDSVLKQHPDAAAAHLLRAQLAIGEDKPDLAKAEKALSEALRLDPANFRTMLFRAEVRLAMDDVKGARRDVDAVTQTNPGLAAGVMMRARVKAASDDAAGAVRDMELVVENVANPPSAWKLQLAAYYTLDERPRKAIEVITEVIADEPENWQAMRSRGDALLSIGKHKEAIADYEQALKLSGGEESGLLNNLAWVLSTSPMDDVRDGKRAIELATKACELTSYKEAHILSTLGSAYGETGDFETAIKWSTKAVELGEGEMKKQLQQELDSYNRKEKWREIQDVKEKLPTAGLLET